MADERPRVVSRGRVPIDGSGVEILPATAAKQPALGTAGTPSADVITVQGIASGTAQAIAGDIAAAAADSGNPVKIGGIVETAAYGSNLTNAQRANLRMTTYGFAKVSPVVALTGADSIANTTISFMANTSLDALPTGVAGWVFNGTTWDRARGDTTGSYVVAKGATSGGLSPARVLTGTTGVIKGSAGQLYSLASVQNANAAVRYLHIYDKATAPTLSTDTPVLTITLAASSIQNAIDFTNIGVAFSLGIAWAYTTDNIAIPATAATSGELMFSAAYK